LHPSNVHDCEYAIGSINFTGDSPVILTRDGPSLGGFVCPVTIAGSELWKIGQVKPGDKIRFVPITYAHALELEAALEERVSKLAAAGIPLSKPPVSEHVGTTAAILDRQAADKYQPKAVWRQAGDNYILLEYGDDVLDLALRLRVHVLMQAIEAEKLPVEELSPGVRSLQIRYRGDRISQSALMRRLRHIEAALREVDTLKLPTRVVRLPLAFQDSATLGAVDRYRETVRAQAPWLPSNVEFIRRINGLASVDEVRDTIFAARYMVLGLGDVYLGAPCAVPVDPRHRLLSSKYNPARTFTAEGTVGIGGMYMCIYGMDSPGGYQLIGRTLPIWNKFLKNSQFSSGEPWLLRFFDQVSFYPVTEEELTVQRDSFREGRSSIEITDEVFDWSAHREFLASNSKEIEDFRARQATAFKEEIAHWLQSETDPSSSAADKTGDRELPSGIQVASHMHGSVWKVLAEPGKRVEEREVLFIIEAMKMEVAVLAPAAGILKSLHCKAGQLVVAGDVLAVIEP
jgi:urea carboxylase